MTGTVPATQQYSAERSPRGFLYHAVRVPALVRVALSSQVLLRHFVGRELLGRFHGSLLGAGWVLIHPLFLFAVYFVVFGVVMGRMGPDTPIEESVRFALYLFSGIVCFHAIAGATGTGLSAVVSNASLVKKVAFPCQLLPLVPVLVETVVFLVGLLVVLILGLAMGAVRPGPSFLLLPWFLLVMIGLATGMGLALANLNVFVRDVRQIYQIGVTAWFFVSPNFWSPDYIKDVAPAGFVPLLKLNPVYHLLIAERQILGFPGEELGFDGNAVTNLAIATLWALAFLLLGYGTFMKHKHRYADLV